MTISPPHDPAALTRRNTRLILIIGTVLDLLALPIAGFWGVMSVMASDAGTTPAISTYINVTITLPLAMLVAPVLAWVVWFLKRYWAAVIVLLIPIPWAILSFALMFTL